MVTYHPWAEVLDHVRRIRAQVDAVMIVDNSGTPAARALLGPLAREPGVGTIFNPENRGIAAAFNQGAARAAFDGFAWIATFDQDSRIPAGFVAGLRTALAAHPVRSKVAVVAPVYRDTGLGFRYSPSVPLPADDPGRAVEVSVTASSGNLVSLAALRDCGGFRDDYFIDCVDFEFCLRLRRRGWRVLEARAVTLDHAQGEWRQRKWLGRSPRYNDYGAVRRYYQARNRVRLYQRFALFDSSWIARDAWGFFCDFLKLLLFCENRAAKVRAMAVGLAHGVVGRMGKWEPTRES